MQSSKREVLRKAGYVYDFDREVFFNRAARKAFSVEFVEDRAVDQLRRCIRESNRGRWRFYFNTPPSETVREDLELALR